MYWIGLHYCHKFRQKYNFTESIKILRLILPFGDPSNLTVQFPRPSISSLNSSLPLSLPPAFSLFQIRPLHTHTETIATPPSIMALQVYSAAPRTSIGQYFSNQGIIAAKLQPSTVCVAAADYAPLNIKRKVRRLRKLTASLDGAAAVAEVGRVTEVNKDTFWPIVKAAGTMTVVLDMYTQWCGPCKVIAPKYQELSEKYEDVVFLKLDCNAENKPLAKELGLKVVPTFKILKDGKVVKEVTGAKIDNLVAAIETARSSST